MSPSRLKKQRLKLRGKHKELLVDTFLSLGNMKVRTECSRPGLSELCCKLIHAEEMLFHVILLFSFILLSLLA